MKHSIPVNLCLYLNMIGYKFLRPCVMRFTLIALSAFLLSTAFTVQAKMYKWVDEDGQMHFGDKIPAKYQAKEHEELNEHGLKARHKEAEKTSAEKAEDKQHKKELELAAREAEKKKRLDRVLLDAYDSERDLIKARDSRLDAVALQVQLSETIISGSSKRLESLEKKVAQAKASNHVVPANLYKSIDIEKKQIATQNRVMAGHKKRGEEISLKYDDYIKRFRAAQEH